MEQSYNPKRRREEPPPDVEDLLGEYGEVEEGPDRKRRQTTNVSAQKKELKNCIAKKLADLEEEERRRKEEEELKTSFDLAAAAPVPESFDFGSSGGKRKSRKRKTRKRKTRKRKTRKRKPRKRKTRKRKPRKRNKRVKRRKKTRKRRR
jgi:hypothetical protein